MSELGGISWEGPWVPGKKQRLVHGADTPCPDTEPDAAGRGAPTHTAISLTSACPLRTQSPGPRSRLGSSATTGIGGPQKPPRHPRGSPGIRCYQRTFPPALQTSRSGGFSLTLPTLLVLPHPHCRGCQLALRMPGGRQAGSVFSPDLGRKSRSGVMATLGP